MRKLFSGIGSFLQTPVGVIITTNVVWQIVMWVMDIPTNYTVYYIVSAVILGLDIFVAFTLRDQLIYFFSQFVLPIQNPKYRQDIFARVRDFETGYRGPALFVKNGRVIKHEGEADKRGGWLDRSGYRQRARPAHRYRDQGYCRTGHQIHERERIYCRQC